MSEGLVKENLETQSLKWLRAQRRRERNVVHQVVRPAMVVMNAVAGDLHVGNAVADHEYDPVPGKISAMRAGYNQNAMKAQVARSV